ncbi:MAG: YihY/virulence factor BrkB family protein, partial [Cellulomonadaceae bacterium]|nr:YihY/virulence factor BrkB family protein [Cellulomonadaceae bacterium]
MKQTIKRGLDWFQATRVGRTLTWYSERNGAQLCGGIAYSALFSLFAALTIGWSFFAASLGRNDALRGAVLDQIDGWVPGLIGTGSTDLVNPDQLVLSRAINPASIIAVIVGLLSAIGVMGALQSAIRSMFHVPAASGKALWKRVGQLLGFLLLGAGVVIAAGVSVASHQMGNLLQHWSAGSAGPAG